MGGNLADLACVGSLEEVEGQADLSWSAAHTPEALHAEEDTRNGAARASSP
jgi:hypothetical protein